jgi:hypothetical protein
MIIQINRVQRYKFVSICQRKNEEIQQNIYIFVFPLF